MNNNVEELRSRSWFCVFNNPEEHGYKGTPDEICEAFKEDWIKEHPSRSCAVTYCISADGLHHLHTVLEDNKLMRFSAVKNAFPSMHIEPTKGSKEQAEDYINKRGKWEEKGEKIIATARYGEIKGSQGQRRDFEIIEDILSQGKTPNEIFSESFSFRRYEKMIRQGYFDKRLKETPLNRPVKVIWHMGESGSGKTYTYVQLCKQYGEENVYLLNDYDKGGFDRYNGESILCMDEFRGNIRYGLLLQYLDGYKVQIPSRYSNSYALWNEVHIFTPLTPEQAYKSMVNDDAKTSDPLAQLLRRIHEYVYHYKDENGNYKSISKTRDEYKNLCDLQHIAHGNKIITPNNDDELPF